MLFSSDFAPRDNKTSDISYQGSWDLQKLKHKHIHIHTNENNTTITREQNQHIKPGHWPEVQELSKNSEQNHSERLISQNITTHSPVSKPIFLNN